jgi:hypothetical protein
VQDHTSGGDIEANLDALADAVAQIEAHSGTADIIIASPQSWAALSKLKTAEDSNASLLGPRGVAAVRQLLSIPVTGVGVGGARCHGGAGPPRGAIGLRRFERGG